MCDITRTHLKSQEETKKTAIIHKAHKHKTWHFHEGDFLMLIFERMQNVQRRSDALPDALALLFSPIWRMPLCRQAQTGCTEKHVVTHSSRAITTWPSARWFKDTHEEVREGRRERARESVVREEDMEFLLQSLVSACVGCVKRRARVAFKYHAVVNHLSTLRSRFED